MEWQDFLGLLSKGEDNDLLFKKSIESPEELANSIVGLANNIGGQVIIGIDIYNSHLTGTNLNSDWVRTVAKTHCFPAVNVSTEIVTKNNRDIMIINVPEGKNKPYVADRTFLFSEPFSSTIQVTSTQTQEQADFKLETKIESPLDEKPKSLLDKLNQRQKSTLDFLSQYEQITNRKYRELFNISHKTAHLELIALVEKGLLVSKGLGRSTHYILASKDNVPPMIVDKKTQSSALAGGAELAGEVIVQKAEPSIQDSEIKLQGKIIKEEETFEPKIEIKPLIKNDQQSTEITIEVKDKYPRIKVYKHSPAKESLEDKILKDTIYRAKDFEKWQSNFLRKEEIVPSIQDKLQKEIIEDKKFKEDEIKAKEISQEEKEIISHKTDDQKPEEEETIVAKPKIKEKAKLKESFRDIEKERDKRQTKQIQKESISTEEIHYEPIEKTENNTIENPDIEVHENSEFDSENKEVIEDGPDQLGIDSFLSS